LDSRVLQQIAKLCLTFQVNPPTKESIFKWLGQFPPENYKGDLRLLQRQIQGLEQVEEEIEIPDGVVPVAWWALWEAWDPLVDLDIENNEGNLASLITLENIPERIEASLGNTHEAWNMYKSLFNAYKVSDQGDFWAFFYQCWQILPLTQQLKLKVTNQIFNQKGAPTKLPPPAENLVFTRVLSRQSALFNAWREMCRIHDMTDIPIRCVPMVAGQFPEQKTKNLSLRQ
jgi:hypothetical protein